MWIEVHNNGARLSQCTYRCVVLPDITRPAITTSVWGLNAPTGAWCSLTINNIDQQGLVGESQCTYRCVVLPDSACRSSTC